MSPCIQFFNRWVYLGILIHMIHLRTFERFMPSRNAKYFIHPGWHQFLPNEWFLFLEIGLVSAIILNVIKSTKMKLLTISILIILDYFTFPFRIMNHYTLLLFIIINQGVWFAFEAKRGETLAYPASEACKKSNLAILGVAFFCAGLHKLNSSYLDPTHQLNAVFWMFKEFLPVLGLQTNFSGKVLMILSIISILIELSFIFLILFKTEKSESYIVLTLLLFLFFLLIAKRIPDYTWIAACFSPLFFSEKKWQQIEKNLITSWKSLLRWIGVSLGISLLFFRHLGIKMLLFVPVVLFFCCLLKAVVKKAKFSEC